MTMQQVIYALEVASALSMSRAAERLYVSQPALSQQVKRLEEELGYPLFLRTAHGIRLTAEGETFCTEAAPVAALWQTLCKKVKADETSKRNRLRLGIGARVYSNRLFSDVLAFFDEHPTLEVALVTEAGQDVLSALQNGELDLALDRLPEREPFSAESPFFAEELIAERQCILMSPADPRAKARALSVRDLHGCTVMSGLEGSAEDRMLKDVCRRYGVKLSRVFRSDGIETNMRLVREGRGVALGPASFAPYFRVAAVPLTPEMFVSLQFICLKSSMQRDEIRRFCTYLKGVCKRRVQEEKA